MMNVACDSADLFFFFVITIRTLSTSTSWDRSPGEKKARNLMREGGMVRISDLLVLLNSSV